MAEDNKAETIDKIVNVLAGIVPVMDQVDFAISIEFEGDAKKEGFEPHIKGSVRVARDTEKALKAKLVDADLADRSFEKQSDFMENLIKVGTISGRPFKVEATNDGDGTDLARDKDQ